MGFYFGRFCNLLKKSDLMCWKYATIAMLANANVILLIQLMTSMLLTLEGENTEYNMLLCYSRPVVAAAGFYFFVLENNGNTQCVTTP